MKMKFQEYNLRKRERGSKGFFSSRNAWRGKVVFLSVFLYFLYGGATHLNAQSFGDATEGEGKCLRSDSLLVSFLKGNGVHTTLHNTVELLPSGHEKFEALLQDIANARHHIHLEYFNFRNDSIASLVFKALAKKAAEGVQVRAMFDDFGNKSNNRPLKKEHLDTIRSLGIEIVSFDPMRFPYINHAYHRDHRKIVVIDGRIGYTGGMNIADYYINGLPEIGPWRDMHMRLKGEVVYDLQRIFLTMWNTCTGQHVNDTVAFYPPLSDSLSYEKKQIAIVDRVPRKLPKLLRQTFARAIDTACDSVLLVNPYFMPTRLVRSALKSALKRGVKVEIMISSKGDIPFTPEGSLYVAHQLMKRGAEVYLFNEGFHHSKIIMIDGAYSTVGSANLNSRSLEYDYEVNAFIFDKGVTDDLHDIYQSDKPKSTILTQQVWKSNSRWKRFVGWVANILTPFM